MTPRSCTTSTLSFEVMQIIETLDSVEPPEDVHAAAWPPECGCAQTHIGAVG